MGLLDKVGNEERCCERKAASLLVRCNNSRFAIFRKIAWRLSREEYDILQAQLTRIDDFKRFLVSLMEDLDSGAIHYVVKDLDSKIAVYDSVVRAFRVSIAESDGGKREQRERKLRVENTLKDLRRARVLLIAHPLSPATQHDDPFLFL